MKKTTHSYPGQPSHGSLTTYFSGFVFSILLTLAAYLAVTHPLYSSSGIELMVVVFAFLQLVVQLVFFLHLNRESSPYWNLTVLVFAAIIVAILMGGSLWIMRNLNQHMMTPSETQTFIVKDEGIK